MIIGVVSDTHSEIHPRVVPILRDAGVTAIWHAGDVGDYAVISELEEIAPVTAVRGNVDVSGSVGNLPVDFATNIEGVSVYMTHIGGKPAEWEPKLPEPKPQLAICGHSHAPLLEQREATLFLNPGAAGVRHRFKLPLGMAIVRIEAGRVEVVMYRLDEENNTLNR